MYRERLDRARHVRAAAALVADPKALALARVAIGGVAGVARECRSGDGPPVSAEGLPA
jgi:hypothetical protein